MLLFEEDRELIMPLTGNQDATYYKLFVERALESAYKFKGVVYHGFHKSKETLEICDMSACETIVKLVNVKPR